MPTTSRFIPLLLAVLALTGCSLIPGSSEMPVDQAGKLYLSQACAANKAVDDFNALVTGSTSKSDWAPIQKAAIVAREANSAAAKALDRTDWPKTVAKDVAIIRDAGFADASYYGAIASSATYDEGNKVTNQDLPGVSLASQRIRSRLKLPSDTAAGC